MTYKVLVVDDSSFFRRRVTEILSEDKDLEVIDVAVNGIDAVEKAISLKPDVITMDIEMPLLNGIDAVKKIMAKAPTAILMFSSLTHKGAKATLDAIDAGALDFLPKKFNEIAKNSEEAGSLLRQRVAQLARRAKGRIQARAVDTTPKVRPNRFASKSALATAKVSNAPAAKTHRRSGKEYKLVAIGTSTGGPIALQKILTKLPSNFPLPIILIQHMPATFTEAFSKRLNSLCAINIKEAEDGDLVKPGWAYLAPGGRQMVIEGKTNNPRIKILEDNSERIAFKPSVDISFGSAAKIFQDSVLAIVLTGMGADGRDGARLLKSKGSNVWTQDEQSCVVYGMPQAVVNAGLSDASFAIEQFSSAIVKEVDHG